MKQAEKDLITRSVGPLSEIEAELKSLGKSINWEVLASELVREEEQE